MKAINAILNTIENYVKKYTQSLPHDKTEQGIVIDILGINKYSVQIKGAVSTVPSAIDQTFEVNDNVLVLFVQGDPSRKYITGKGG